MTGQGSNEVWKGMTDWTSFETRAFRFREEMRPLFFHYLGITPQSRVLDAGCGTGAFTRYLAKGLDGGHITGFDINEAFIQEGCSLAKAEGLQPRMRLDVADGLALPFEDGTFDAVTNYTYVGVLSDPRAGVLEMRRVCRPGGLVSCVVATTSIPAIEWMADEAFEGAGELQALITRENYIFASFVNMGRDLLRQSRQWSVMQTPRLLAACGLGDIRLDPFGYCLCFDDGQFDAAYRRSLALANTREDIRWRAYRFEQNREVYRAHGYTQADAERMEALSNKRAAYLEEKTGEDMPYSWIGGFNFIASGRV